MKIFNNHRGVSTIAAMLVMLTLVAMGGVITYLTAGGQTSRMNHYTSSQAFNVVQAGIEYAFKKVYEGENGVVNPAVNFGPGSFTVSLNGNVFTVTGTVGDTVRVHNVDRPTESDCFDIGTNSATLVAGDTRITNLLAMKACLASITIDQITVTWFSEGEEAFLTQIRIQNADIYNNPAVPSGTQINVTDYIIDDDATHVITSIDFTDQIDDDQPVTITFLMGDGSIETVTINFIE